MSTRTSDKLAKAFDEALDKHSGGETVEWDLGVLPAQNGQLVHVFTLVSPSPLLGQFLQISSVISNGFEFGDANCDQLVLDAIEQIRQQRSNLLSSPQNQPNYTGDGHGDKQNIIPIGGK